MAEQDKAPAAATVPFSQPPAMNYSNAGFERVSERVERSRDDPQVGMAQLSDLKGPPVKKPAQMMAASALTSLKPGTTGQEEYLPEDDPDCDFQIPLRFTKSGRRRATPFPMKLMKVLSTKRFNDIICWTPDGSSFAILRPKAFASEILPTYFKEAKYSSFTRKLHRWGFQRHLRGADTGSFYHKNFQRGRLDLLDLMTCYKPREASARAAGKFPKSRGGAAAGQPSMMPPADLLAEAQAIRARQHQAEMMGIQTPMGEVSEERLNAAIELEVSRRLQQRVDAASFSRFAMMQQGSPPAGMSSLEGGMGMPGYPSGSPARFPPGAMSGASSRGVPPPQYDPRLQQQVASLRLARGFDDPRMARNFDEQQQQSHFDPNLDLNRGA